MLYQDGLPTPQRHYATGAIMATLVLVVLDGVIADVALPTLAATLQVSAGASIWVVNSYQLALVMTLLPCAALGESLGLRHVFISGVALFTTASLMCALSPSLPWLVAARFVQGVGGAAVLALGIGLIRFTYPHRLLGSIIGWNATVIALSAAAGPTIGAAILSVTNWLWLFAVNLPVGAVVLLLARFLPQPAVAVETNDRLRHHGASVHGCFGDDGAPYRAGRECGTDAGRRTGERNADRSDTAHRSGQFSLS
ncbi:MAG: MFS transporter [Janthinobacterium lividum]